MAQTRPVAVLYFFFFNDTATTEIYTLSLHDALPISTTDSRYSVARRRDRARATAQPRVPGDAQRPHPGRLGRPERLVEPAPAEPDGDRKSTRLNSSH